MSENSESRIIVVQNFLELETPVISPFQPRKLSDIFNEDFVKRDRIDAIYRPSLRVMPSFIEAVGHVLDSNVDTYFSEAAKTAKLDVLSPSIMMDQDKISELDTKLDQFINGLGSGERAYLENRMAIHQVFLEMDSKKGRENDPRYEEYREIAGSQKYLFNLLVGNDCINLLMRLFMAPQTSDTPICKRFIEDAIKYKFAGQILWRGASLYEDGIIFNRAEEKDISWNRLFREVAIKADPRYLALKL